MIVLNIFSIQFRTVQHQSFSQWQIICSLLCNHDMKHVSDGKIKSEYWSLTKKWVWESDRRKALDHPSRDALPRERALTKSLFLICLVLHKAHTVSAEKLAVYYSASKNHLPLFFSCSSPWPVVVIVVIFDWLINKLIDFFILNLQVQDNEINVSVR